MQTYSSGLSLYQVFTNDTTSTNQTNGAIFINEATKRLVGVRDWPFLEKSATATTTTSQFYTLPFDCGKILDVTVTIGTTIYTPKLAPSADFWDRLNYASGVTSNIPEWFWVFNGQLGFWPTPSSAGSTITYRYKRLVKDLNIADDTTRTITTLANGSAALTVSAGLTAQMVGFWIRPTFSTTANTGDGNWYQLSAIGGATTATLASVYGGNSIAAGTAASTIAQISVIPEQYQILPIYEAAAQYYRFEGEFASAEYYEKKLNEGIKQMEDDYGSKTTSRVIRRGIDDGFPPNPNLFASGLTN